MQTTVKLADFYGGDMLSWHDLATVQITVKTVLVGMCEVDSSIKMAGELNSFKMWLHFQEKLMKNIGFIKSKNICFNFILSILTFIFYAHAQMI